ncbi:hypothetical protein WH87_04740 [Devosia epidermidihirudinis]|uniref:Uncharacterized protein n=1 Tax=Devosia epidermidihirudinis TaxID=1293439 RepID=A0A0F5QFI4_9HYPH|nr:hypothetical protein [Devosia epidermidihirudinis]KKC39506.1 hypothetical protein WH87_04740 [Devosia epidermidihirudinis]
MPERFPDSILSFEINLSDAGHDRPVLSAEAGRLFAKWANVEYTLSTMASVLLGDTAALAILDSIRARNSQTDAIKAAAQEKIEHEETRALLNPLFKLIERAARPRNMLAHCMWGTIPQLPDALLLCDPKAMLKASRLLLQTEGTRSTTAPSSIKTEFEHELTGSDAVPLAVTKLVRENTEVWRQADFHLPRKLLDRSIIGLTQLTIAISSDPHSAGAAQARSQLKAHLAETELLR